jgi:hypothetical protein
MRIVGYAAGVIQTRVPPQAPLVIHDGRTFTRLGGDQTSNQGRGSDTPASACYNLGVTPDESAVGCTGTVIVATRGEAGPGEVLVKVRGGTEAYLAWSEQPLATGTEVIVYNARGDRTLDVMEFSSGADGA